MLFNLSQTETGIYYLHKYVPWRKRQYCSVSEAETSEKIYLYKTGDADALNLFTNELMWAVAEISRKTSADKIGLVAVPPSKVNKDSTIRTSIWNMMNWYKQGIADSVFGFKKTLYDYGMLLTRSSDISTAHEGVRATYDEQKASITCSRSGLSKYWTTFIILDDVTTIGTSMDVCRDIMVEHGAMEKYIFRLAIGRTV